MFNLELRNIIAHDGWFYKEKDFCYKKTNGKIIRLNFKDFEQTIKNQQELIASIVGSLNYYMPDLEIQRRLEKIKQHDSKRKKPDGARNA